MRHTGGRTQTVGADRVQRISAYHCVRLNLTFLWWAAYLAGFGIATVTDDIGREAISRADAKMLLDEQREREARRAELLRRADEAAIESTWRGGRNWALVSGERDSCRHERRPRQCSRMS